MQTVDKAQCETGTPNHHYDLISFVYHALEGAATYNQYIEDAKQAGDDELADFFTQVVSQMCDRAEKAKNLLKERLQ